MWTIGVDPGLKGLACAVVCGSGDLQAAFFEAADGDRRDPRQWDRMCRRVVDRCLLTVGSPFSVVIENPTVYVRGKGAPSRDILPIANVVGVLSAHFMLLKAAEVSLVLPAEWKGQVPKKVHQGRIAAALTDGEIEKISADRKADLVDILDAVGIAKKYAPGA